MTKVERKALRKFAVGCLGETDENSPAFQRWDTRTPGQVPKGRLKDCANPEASGFSRPFGTRIRLITLPGVETPGYYRDVPPGQTFIEFPNDIKVE